jgi:hypothetical protein
MSAGAEKIALPNRDADEIEFEQPSHLVGFGGISRLIRRRPY